jgi:diadenosine tetraphosphate (Ap4A) HIT family hydrolase
MAQHPEDCDICSRISQIKEGTHPGFIAELETGYVVLGDSQYFRGYTLFLCKEAAPDLEDLPREFRFQFLKEMALVSEAVAKVIQPHKMNVESLGNMAPHLHFHLFPRQLSEKEPKKPVWLVMPSDEEAEQYALNSERDADLIESLKKAVAEVAD